MEFWRTAVSEDISIPASIREQASSSQYRVQDTDTRKLNQWRSAEHQEVEAVVIEAEGEELQEVAVVVAEVSGAVLARLNLEYSR